jgi:hypothetical protein
MYLYDYFYFQIAFLSSQEELGEIEKKLLEKEDLLLREKELLEQEMHNKEIQLQEWEKEFHDKELEFSSSLDHLRRELDTDYRQQMVQLESTLQDRLTQEMDTLVAGHQEQVLWG